MRKKNETISILAGLIARLPEKASSGTDDFFHCRVHEEIDALVAKIELAVNNGSLYLDDAHSGSDLVLENAFRGGSEAVFRGVHFLRDTHFMSSPLVSLWKTRLMDLLSQGRLRAVRRIVIATDAEEIESRLAQDFISYHFDTPNHEIRCLSERTLRSQVQDSLVPVPHDFGVYGDTYAFVSSACDPESLAGTWYRERREVVALTDLFDKLWSSARLLS